MNKKIGFAVILVLVLVITIAGLWKWKNQSFLSQSDSNNENFSDYEVPELGIKFRVTSETKEDLKYDFKEYNTEDSMMKILSSSFYSVAERQSKSCVLSEGGYNCGRFDIYRVSKKESDEFTNKYNKPWCESTGGKIILENENDRICLFSKELSLKSDSDYRKFFHIDREENKKFGILIDSIQFIK